MSPTYNSGLPKKGVIYIFSSKKYNATTIYYADDVVTDDMRQAYDDLIDALDKVVKAFQDNPVVKACPWFQLLHESNVYPSG